FLQHLLGGIRFASGIGVPFQDVPPGHPFYPEIGKLSSFGITAGCGNGNYCPEAAVTREQMAIFIERALGAFMPPMPAAQRFVDVPPTRAGYAFIDDFAARRITNGCGGDNYCPDFNVTREQVAIFIIRALGDFDPPVPAAQRFADVSPARS